jgi:uncharacterized protein YwgA
MTTPDQLIADVVRAADGEIIGRIRLQKVFYLLEQAGLGAGLSFHYHHYGPYSRELDNAIDRARALRGVEERIKHRQSDGMPYSVFLLRPGADIAPPKKIGHLPFGKAKRLVALFKAQTSTVLELAATIHWLAKKERVRDWRRELVRRKGVKTERGRMDEAVGLLKELGLAPA